MWASRTGSLAVRLVVGRSWCVASVAVTSLAIRPCPRWASTLTSRPRTRSRTSASAPVVAYRNRKRKPREQSERENENCAALPRPPSESDGTHTAVRRSAHKIQKSRSSPAMGMASIFLAVNLRRQFASIVWRCDPTPLKRKSMPVAKWGMRIGVAASW